MCQAIKLCLTTIVQSVSYILNNYLHSNSYFPPFFVTIITVEFFTVEVQEYIGPLTQSYYETC